MQLVTTEGFAVTSPAKSLVWDAKCERTFQTAEALLRRSPALSAPASAAPFEVEVDVSGAGAAAVLLQEDSFDPDQPVCYFSR